jgi:hypothetical protein
MSPRDGLDTSSKSLRLSEVYLCEGTVRACIVTLRHVKMSQHGTRAPARCATHRTPSVLLHIRLTAFHSTASRQPTADSRQPTDTLP